MKWIYTLTVKNELTVQIKNYMYIAYTLFLIHWHVKISDYLLLISNFHCNSVSVNFKIVSPPPIL